MNLTLFRWMYTSWYVATLPQEFSVVHQVHTETLSFAQTCKHGQWTMGRMLNNFYSCIKCNFGLYLFSSLPCYVKNCSSINLRIISLLSLPLLFRLSWFFFVSVHLLLLWFVKCKNKSQNELMMDGGKSDLLPGTM